MTLPPKAASRHYHGIYAPTQGAADSRQGDVGQGRAAERWLQNCGWVGSNTGILTSGYGAVRYQYPTNGARATGRGRVGPVRKTVPMLLECTTKVVRVF